MWGVDGVAIDRHGLILWENEATVSRKVFRYLRGRREAVQNLKIAAKVQNAEIPYFTVSLYYWTPHCYQPMAGIMVFPIDSPIRGYQPS